jgi:hypothetical protein
MYVQYFIPQNERGALPLLMWHGGGLTGVTYETTPDGREGWLNYFIKKGWAVYNSDAVERGRAGWTDSFKGDPVFLTKENPFERFRIGTGPGSYNKDPAKMKVQVAQARPDKVKALVLVEPAGLGDPKLTDRLKNTPILTVYGDFIEQDSRWPTIRANELKFLEQVRAAGGRYDVVNLPQAGIKGNSHMMMMDKNNLQVADVIQGWLEKQGLYK